MEKLYPRTGGMLLVPEDELEATVLLRLHKKGKLDSHLASAREAGCVSYEIPNVGIFFPIRRFGQEKMTGLSMDMFIEAQLVKFENDQN